MPRNFDWRLSLRALGGRLGTAWERERRDTLFLLGAIALSVAPHGAHLPWWCSAGFAMLFVWRLGLVLSGRWMPRPQVRWIAAIACLLAVWAQYHTLIGREPGVALLVLFLGLKLLEMHARRDVFVVIFLCMFLLVAAFFQSQGIVTAVVALAALVALVMAMTTMQLGAHETRPTRRLADASVLVAQALPLAAVMFLLFPRLSGPLWGMPGDDIGARTGLSDTMTPGSMLQLGLSDEIAFRVAFDGSAPAPAQLYWRGPTFGLFDGRTWRAGRDTAAAAPRPEVSADDAAPRTRYTVTAEPTQRSELYTLEAPGALPVLAGHEVGITPDFDVLVQRPLTTRVRWDGVALLGARIGLNETPSSLQSWLQLPPGSNPRTRELAARWRGTDQTNGQLVQRALNMFGRDGFAYTLSPPALGRDPVDDFLFGTRAGFCEHYSSAFVVLMRALGIPARVVTGYQGGEPNPVDGFWVVRQADAHAWAEVWLDGSGWTRVDPTAAIAPDRIERGVRAARPASAGLAAVADIPMLRSWRLNLEAVSNAWNQWVLSYDRARQLQLLQRLGLPVNDWLELVGMMAIALMLPIGAIALVTLRPRRPADPLDRCWHAFCAKLAAAGIERAPQDTPNRMLARAEHALSDDATREKLRRIVGNYNRLRYDVPRPSPNSVRQLRRLIDAFKI